MSWTRVWVNEGKIYWWIAGVKITWSPSWAATLLKALRVVFLILRKRWRAVTKALVLPPTSRQRAHHRVGPYPGARKWNHTEMFSGHESVDPSSFSCAGSLFHARGAAAEKALMPIRRRVRGTTRLLHGETINAVYYRVEAILCDGRNQWLHVCVQHYISVLSSLLVYPLVVSYVLCVGHEWKAMSEIMSTMLFVTGIATLLQCLVGCRSVS